VRELSLLSEPVQKFVTDLTPRMVELSRNVAGATPVSLERDVALESQAIAASFLASDGRISDVEAQAYAVAFAPWVDSLTTTTPAQLRELLQGRRGWKSAPSQMFELLVAADQRDNTAHAHTYYEDAMKIAHAACALDQYPAPEELADLDAFRSMLLGRLPSLPATATRAAVATEPAVAAPVEPQKSLEELLADLDELVGLSAVKEEVHTMVDLLRIEALRRERDLPVAERSEHLVFTGNPGTGKTTVARLLAGIFRELDVVPKGQLVETDRGGLVAGFVGQTAPRVKEVFEQALGGVLFIDEAYALVTGGEQDFGAEAVATLLKLMEDHRDDIVVIVAGYPVEMREFVDSNPGLRSRFSKTIDFPDYSTDELVQIFEQLCTKHRYVADDGARQRVRAYLDGQQRGRGFGNARLARNLFEAAIARQARRVVATRDKTGKPPTTDELCALAADDIPQ
jgi:AAA+ superfamily predicted ATPase